MKSTVLENIHIYFSTAYCGDVLQNPGLSVDSIAKAAAFSRAIGITVLLDNTALPILARPFPHKVAIILNSLTEYIGGHGTSVVRV